ncbi:MAG: DUF1501 domain-containing protein [Planctomycetota bacterium]|nr:MAG: DUF1501 domain-containing protein [Planctomycetota bacterium]
MPPRVTRRDVLRLAATFGLSFTLPPIEPRAAEKRGPERPKSFLLIWLAGGPSQLETWDPHPGTKIGGPTRAIATTLRGVSIADSYPRLAEQMHHLSVIRSLVSKEGDHERGTYFVKTGYRPDPTLTHPVLGSIVAREHPNPELEIPQFVSLGSSPHRSRAGFLGAQFDPFRVPNPGRNLQNMRPPVPADRQQRRLANLEVVSRAFRSGRRLAVEKTLHEHTVRQALRMMSSDQLKAFELDDEPRAVQRAYGDTNFGRGCLVARRLIETGVPAVEVTLPGWDTHQNNFDGHRAQAEQLDPALSTLIRELVERDLYQSTVLLCIGEFGRTPEIRRVDGRDHWPTGFSCLLGGGGLNAGVVIGETDPHGEKKMPASPVPVADLSATVLHALGIDHQQEFITPIGRPLSYSQGQPIPQLVQEIG